MLYSTWLKLLFQFSCLLCFSIYNVYAFNKNLSIDLDGTTLTDAVYLLAKFNNINVIIDPSVNGNISLHLKNMVPADAFNLLLSGHGLAKWRSGNIWFIAPREELIKRKREEFKWQETLSETTSLVTKVWLIKYGKAEEIAKLIENEKSSLISKRGSLRVDARTNIVCVKDTRQHIGEIDHLIHALDVPVKQILIAARLASVDNDFERHLGIHFGVQTSSREHVYSEKDKTGEYTMTVAKLADSSILDVKLAALEAAGHAELISCPTLFTSNHKLASIEAGEEVPYQEISEGGGTAVAFKKAVLGLKVIPQILPGNKVLLELQVNQDRPSNKMILGVPAITTRQIKTHVLVKSGQTIVLGGVYESIHDQDQQGLPFVSHIPLIGFLFKQQATSFKKRELLIFVTPTIVT